MRNLSLLLIYALTIMAPFAEAREISSKYAQLELGGKLGNHRNIGMAKLMLPLVRQADSLLFCDFRSRIDDDESKEYNAGLGYRFFINDGGILGFYTFYDRLRSSYSHYFDQMTVGGEYLTEDWDLRLNTYVPENKKVMTDPLSTLDINGSSIGVRAGYEKPLPGFDAELGYRLPVDAVDLRWFAGGYYFHDSGFRTVAGPRTRLEMTTDHWGLRLLPADTALTLGLEFQHDNVRSEQFFATAKVRIPFGKGVSIHKPVLKSLESRMMNFIERDIDIVIGTSRGPTETAVIDGRAVTSAVSVPSGGDLETAVSTAPAQAMIMLSGAQSSTSTLALKTGQVLVGGATQVSVRGQASGTVFTYTVPGTRPTISAGVPLWDDILSMNNATTIKGIDIVDTGAADDAIIADGVADVKVSDVTVTDSDYGVNVTNGSSSVTVSDATFNSVASSIYIYNAGSGSPHDITIRNVTVNQPTGDGMNVVDASAVTVEHVVVNDPGGFGLYLSNLSNVTITDYVVKNSPGDVFGLANDLANVNGTGLGTTGTVGGSLCSTMFLSSMTGTLHFTNGTTCP